MSSALKRGCKHQRKRQAQKKRERHTTLIPIGFTTIPLFFLLSFLPPKPGIYSFKSLGNPLQNKRDNSHSDLENLSFFLFIFPFFFLFFSLTLFSFTLHDLFCLYLSFIKIRAYSILHIFSPRNCPNQFRTSPAL